MTYIKRVIGSVAIVSMIGCSSTTCIYPSYPKPNQVVLDKINSLKSIDVDNWMMEQYKLKMKLENR